MTIKTVLTRIAQILIGAFALIGFVFTLIWLGMHFGIFNVRGSIQARNEFFTGATILGTLPCTSTVCLPTETAEWATVREGLKKDSATILRVSAQTGVPARYIAAVVVPEQLRFFTSEREVYKQVFEPLKILGSMSQFSLGVSGIKQETALEIEHRIPPELKPLIQYPEGVDQSAELYKRLTDSQDHYYAYLYTALFIREVEDQWAAAGFPISNRPAIIATLFNIGFGNSRPSASPAVGGAPVSLAGHDYLYGDLAQLFYDAPDLSEVFVK